MHSRFAETHATNIVGTLFDLESDIVKYEVLHLCFFYSSKGVAFQFHMLSSLVPTDKQVWWKNSRYPIAATICRYHTRSFRGPITGAMCSRQSDTCFDANAASINVDGWWTCYCPIVYVPVRLMWCRATRMRNYLWFRLQEILELRLKCPLCT